MTISLHFARFGNMHITQIECYWKYSKVFELGDLWHLSMHAPCLQFSLPKGLNLDKGVFFNAAVNVAVAQFVDNMRVLADAFPCYFSVYSIRTREKDKFPWIFHIICWFSIVQVSSLSNVNFHDLDWRWNMKGIVFFLERQTLISNTLHVQTLQFFW